MDKVRETALKVLYEVDKKGAYSNIALNEILKSVRKSGNEIDNRDVGFISEIVYGTVAWKLTIDEIIKKYSTIKLKKISPWIINILRMSIYQIVFLDKVPKSAVVNEGVNLAKRYGHQGSKNFVNAVLRKVEKKDYEEFFAIKNDAERISKTTSMPVWLVEKLIKETSIQKAEEICKASNLRPILWIRTNTLKITPEELKNRLNEEKIEAQIDGNFLIIQGIKNIENLSLFKEGLFTIQDKTAGLIPEMLKTKPGEKVLDACSSPGGKTTYMAEKMKNQGEIIAWDIHPHRVKLVEETSKRLGITIIKTEEKDATKYEEKYRNYFDKILLDVPCLGLGVIKRKPDIKWQKQSEGIEEITKIQKNILKNCSKYLKDGGELVYATCSILKEENEEVIYDFLENNKTFEMLEEIQIYPSKKNDGFFMAKLQKKE